MKKSILLLAVAVGMLASCDPIKEEADFNVDNITSDQLLAKASFVQYAQNTDENGNVSYVQAPDGNYIWFDCPGASSLYIYTLQADGSEFKLSSGTSGGMFALVPRRGSDPNQTVYFRYINQDGKEVVASKQVTVYVPQESPYELKLLASNDYGEKVWKWDPSITGQVWGNMGYCGGKGSDVGISGNGQWWGVGDEEGFLTQLNHTDDGAYHNDGSLDATMVINEDGTIKCYDKDGNVIRQGTFSIEGFDDSNPDAWRVGMLKTTAGAILWPYQINAHDNDPDHIMPTEFEIVYLTADKLTLVYPDKGDYGSLGNWGEATFWHFFSNSDISGMAAGYGNGKDWTWDYDGENVIWGNMGYCGGSGADVGLKHNGQWWGVTDEAGLMTQLNHTNDGAAHGDESMDAYFSLGTDGSITRHAGDGSVINSGTYEFDLSVANEWKLANMKTTAGTILWPYQINAHDNDPDNIMPTLFEVVYLTSEKMCLVYPDKGDFGSLGGWGEATFWHFKAK